MLRLGVPLLALASFALFLAATIGAPAVAAQQLLALTAAHDPQRFLLIALLLAYARFLATEAIAPLFRDDEPTALGPSARPELVHLSNEIARALQTRPLDEVQLTDEPNCAVFESRGRRHLVLGLPLLDLLTRDELRAVIAHELSHFTHGHTTLLRVVERVVRSMSGVGQRLERSRWCVLNPLYWSARLSVDLIARAYHPWAQQLELEADRTAAQVAGAHHLGSALRKLQRDAPDAQLGGRTHPPIAERIAALRDLSAVTGITPAK